MSLDGLAFDEDLLDLLADRLADRLASRLELAIKPQEALINAADVACLVGMKRGWVYEHAGDLGAVRLGPGPRPRLGFYPARVNEYLESIANPPPISLPTHAPPRRRQRRRPRPGYTASGVKLLPIRGHPTFDT
jgi:hypothetical protein